MMTYYRIPGENMQLWALLYVHVGVGGRGRGILMDGRHIEALGEAVLTVGSLARLHQDSHGGSHVYLNV